MRQIPASGVVFPDSPRLWARFPRDGAELVFPATVLRAVAEEPVLLAAVAEDANEGEEIGEEDVRDVETTHYRVRRELVGLGTPRGATSDGKKHVTENG